MDKIFTDVTSEFSADDIEANKQMSMVAYIGILVLIPFLSKPDSAFLKHNINQGIPIAIINILSAIILPFIPVVGGILNMVITFGCLGLIVNAIINISKGKAIRYTFLPKKEFI